MKNPEINLLNVDCMEYMKGLPDKAFELAIVDVPYGIGENGSTNHTRSKLAKPKDYKAFYGLDASAPDQLYFDELLRVSKNQIIWGANHFISKIPLDSPCWIIWDKVNGENDFADCELAWSSFKTAARKVKFMWHGFMQGSGFDGKMQGNKALNETRIHPTQKPVALYKWLLHNYAKPGDKILDTHGGSMSIAIACHQMGFDLTLCELDKDYYEAGVKRFKEQTKQLALL